MPQQGSFGGGASAFDSFASKWKYLGKGLDGRPLSPSARLRQEKLRLAQRSSDLMDEKLKVRGAAAFGVSPLRASRHYSPGGSYRAATPAFDTDRRSPALRKENDSSFLNRLQGAGSGPKSPRTGLFSGTAHGSGRRSPSPRPSWMQRPEPSDLFGVRPRSSPPASKRGAAPAKPSAWPQRDHGYGRQWRESRPLSTGPGGRAWDAKPGLAGSPQRSHQPRQQSAREWLDERLKSRAAMGAKPTAGRSSPPTAYYKGGAALGSSALGAPPRGIAGRGGLQGGRRDVWGPVQRPRSPGPSGYRSGAQPASFSGLRSPRQSPFSLGARPLGGDGWRFRP